MSEEPGLESQERNMRFMLGVVYFATPLVAGVWLALAWAGLAFFGASVLVPVILLVTWPPSVMVLRQSMKRNGMGHVRLFRF